MKLTSLLSLPVVSRATAEELGRIDQVVVDAPGHRVTGLVLRSGDVVPVAAARIGADAAVVDDAGSVTAPADGGEKRPVLIGARALAEDGDELGTVSDLEIDAEGGVIEAILLGGSALDGSALLGVGSYAVVVASGGADDRA